MTDFITPADLKNLGYTSYPPNDILTAMCTGITSIVENFCNQPIQKTLTTEFINVRFAITGYNKLFPSYLPIISVEDLKVYETLTTFVQVPQSSYVIDKRIGGLLVDNGYHGRLRISYYHGYETTPEQIKQAAILIGANLINDYLKREHTNLDDVIKIKDENQELQFSQDAISDNIPPSARKLLMNYRRIR
jgi:hypothetical protein